MSQVFVGIGGGTGSGKSTIALAIKARLLVGKRPFPVQIISQDRFFKPVANLPTYYSAHYRQPRPDFNRPDSFDTAAMFDYFTHHTRSGILVLEGILALYYPELRQLMDIKCYVSVPLEQMLVRRTQRNLAAGYGGGVAEIGHYNRECVTPQHLRYNAPTQRYADIVIAKGEGQERERETAVSQICERIVQSIVQC